MHLTFEQLVDRWADTADVAFAQAAIRAMVGERQASKWVSDITGRARRTAQRWLSDKYPPNRAQEIRELVAKASIVSQLIAAAQTIDPGSDKVSVVYKGDGRDEGTRSIPRFGITGNVDAYLDAVIEHLRLNDLTGAADAFSDAVICGYEDGLEDTLAISRYGRTFDIIT